jgi:hypothetical protein
MSTRRDVLLAGSLWELVRFFLVLLIFVAVLQDAVGAGPWVYTWLLFVSSGNLLIAAGAGMLGLFPDRYGPLIGFLRLGKLMSVFCFLLLIVSGSLRVAATRMILVVGPVRVSQGLALVVVFLLDILFLGALVAWKAGEKPTVPPAESSLPGYSESEVDDYH